MKSKLKHWISAASLAVLAASTALAQDGGPLVDALVRKGVLTAQEAEDIRADLVKDFASTPAGKLNISSHITQLKLYGDARWRYQWNEARTQRPVPFSPGGVQTDSQQERNRYRIRVGAEYQFTDRFSGGFELASGTANDSNNQTMGAAYGKFSINVNLLYLTYKPTDWATITLGKQRNPLYTTDMVWDPDITPEGGSEQFNFKVNDCLSIGLTAGQFIYADNNEFNQQGIYGGVALGNTDVWVFAEQIPIVYKPIKPLAITFAPGIMTYMAGATATGDVGIVNTSGPAFANLNGADNLNLVLLPGEVKYDLDICGYKKPLKLYWDFSYNIDGKARVQDTYLYNNGSVPNGAGNPNPPAGEDAYKAQNVSLSDNIAWLIGVQYGENKKKGDFSARVDFRQVGLGAVDPNIADSDWALGQLNQQGLKGQVVYNFTDFLTGSVTYYNTWNYKQDLIVPTGFPAGPSPSVSSGTLGGAELAPSNTTQVLQVDLIWKF